MKNEEELCHVGNTYVLTTSFIQKHILQKSGQFLLQKSEVRLSREMKGQIS